MAVVPEEWLVPGSNTILISYSDSNYDHFIINDLVLWYETLGCGISLLEVHERWINSRVLAFCLWSVLAD